MGCCSSSKLPPNAKPLSTNDSRVTEILQDLQGEWEVYHIIGGTKSYQTALTVTDNNYKYKTDSVLQPFYWFAEPHDANRIYYDKEGSFFESINTAKGEVRINTAKWEKGSVVWNRPEKHLFLSQFQKSKSASMEIDLRNLQLHSEKNQHNINEVAETTSLTAPPSSVKIVCADCAANVQKSDAKMYENNWYCAQCFDAYY
eukprot:UN04857